MELSICLLTLIQYLLICSNIVAEELKVITYATNKDNARNLIDFSNRYLLNLTIVGLDTQWKGFYDKIHGYYNYMKSIKYDDTNVFLLMDAYDTIPLCSEQLLLSKYHSFGADIVFATAKECWPDPKVENVLYKHYENNEMHMYNYYQWSPWFLCLNSGTIMGTYYPLLSMLESIENLLIENNGSCQDFEGNIYGKNSESDQRCYTTYLIQHIQGMHTHSNISIKLDFTQALFGSLGGMRYFEFDFSINTFNSVQITNKITKNAICIMHGNGVGVIMLRSFIDQINNNGFLQVSEILFRIHYDFIVSLHWWFVYVITKHPTHYLMNNWDINTFIDFHSTTWDEQTVLSCQIKSIPEIILIICGCRYTFKFLRNYSSAFVFYPFCVLFLSYVCYVCMNECAILLT